MSISGALEASLDICVSAHKLPFTALVNFNQWYGFNFLAALLFEFTRNIRPFPDERDPPGKAGVGGTLVPEDVDDLVPNFGGGGGADGDLIWPKGGGGGADGAFI